MPAPRPRPSPRLPLVLVADDNEDTREMYAAFLRGQGFQVDIAANGDETLAKALANPPDVLVLDVAMPDIDGLAVARALKTYSRTEHVRIIAVSGYALEGVEKEAREAGVDVYLTKPCLPDAITNAIGFVKARLIRAAASTRVM